jgi:hypothetical protein
MSEEQRYEEEIAEERAQEAARCERLRAECAAARLLASTKPLQAICDLRRALDISHSEHESAIRERAEELDVDDGLSFAGDEPRELLAELEQRHGVRALRNGQLQAVIRGRVERRAPRRPRKPTRRTVLRVKLTRSLAHHWAGTTVRLSWCRPRPVERGLWRRVRRGHDIEVTVRCDDVAQFDAGALAIVSLIRPVAAAVPAPRELPTRIQLEELLSRSERQQLITGSPQATFDRALEEELVTLDEFERAARAYGTGWNYCGS